MHVPVGDGGGAPLAHGAAPGGGGSGGGGFVSPFPFAAARAMLHGGMSASLCDGHVIEGGRVVRVDSGGGEALQLTGGGAGSLGALAQAVVAVAGAAARAAGAPAAAVRDGMASRDRRVAGLSTLM